MATNESLRLIINNAGAIASIFELVSARCYDIDHDKFDGLEERLYNNMLHIVEMFGRPRAELLSQIFKGISNIQTDNGQDAAKQFLTREVK